VISSAADGFLHVAQVIRINEVDSAAGHASVTHFDLIRGAITPELVAVANEVAEENLGPDDLAKLLRAGSGER